MKTKTLEQRAAELALDGGSEAYCIGILYEEFGRECSVEQIRRALMLAGAELNPIKIVNEIAFYEPEEDDPEGYNFQKFYGSKA